MDQEREITFRIPEQLAIEAEALGLQLEEAFRRGLWLIMRSERRNAEWQEENKDAIAAFNRWLDKNGLPLARYRLF